MQSELNKESCPHPCAHPCAHKPSRNIELCNCPTGKCSPAPAHAPVSHSQPCRKPKPSCPCPCPCPPPPCPTPCPPTPCPPKPTPCSLTIPTISRINPPTGSIYGSNVVTIYGTNLKDVKYVYFNTIATTSIEIINNETMTVVVPNLSSESNANINVYVNTGINCPISNILTYVLLLPPVI